MPPDTALPFGALLKRLRRAASITQMELAVRAGYSAVYISMLERGARQPIRTTVALLADALKISAQEHHALEEAAGFAPSAAAIPAVATSATNARVASDGAVTLLFTDIEGSTRLLGAPGETYADALAAQREMVRTAVAAHGGAEMYSQGNASCFVFPCARDALTAAATAQRALVAHEWPATIPAGVRMGLHSGEPQLGPAGFVGIDVRRAGWIAAASHGGQMLLSAATSEMVKYDLPDDMALLDLGERLLKETRRGERIFQLVCAGLPSEFPPLRTLERYQHNLPIQPNILLGREHETAAMSALLCRDDVRLVTLTGPGGIGKTRLAIEVAVELLSDFADGVYFVRLSRLADSTLTLPTIARALDLKEARGQPIAETLRAYLGDRRLLLVLDNFEQIVAAAPEIWGLLESAPSLKVLVTSRVPLRLRGEHGYVVGPLATPSAQHTHDIDALSRVAAVALFIQRAQEARLDFALSPDNALTIAEICARLDGLPLAIELAAARVRILPPASLLALLSQQLRLLTGGARDAEEHQQTMRATLAWSEDLLIPAERALFRRLSVFVGGCTLEAAEAVCVAPVGAAPLELDLLDGLSTLVDQSLVQQREEGGEARFGMLRVVREYALERLAEAGETVALRTTHARSFLLLAEEAGQHEYSSAEDSWLNRLQLEHENLLAALVWAQETRDVALGLRMAGFLGNFWLKRCYYTEGRAWLESFLAFDGVVAGDAAGEALRGEQVEPTARALALASLGSLLGHQGNYAMAEKALEEALASYRESGHPAGMAYALFRLGITAGYQHDDARAEALLTDALTLARQHDERLAPLLLANLGTLFVEEGDLNRAEPYLQESERLAQQRGDTNRVEFARLNLGEIALRRGDHVGAARVFRSVLRYFWTVSNLRLAAICLECLGMALAALGEDAPPARLFGMAAALYDEVGAVRDPSDQAMYDDAVRQLRTRMDNVAYDAALAAGRATDREQAIPALFEPRGE